LTFFLSIIRIYKKKRVFTVQLYGSSGVLVSFSIFKDHTNTNSCSLNVLLSIPHETHYTAKFLLRHQKSEGQIGNHYAPLPTFFCHGIPKQS
jgi:hypothetical protein